MFDYPQELIDSLGNIGARTAIMRQGWNKIIEAILDTLSQTHTIVPKEQHDRLLKVLEAAAIVRTQGVLRKTCATLNRKDFIRLELSVADWEVHAGIGYSERDLEVLE
jgi:hypothetical protein